MGWVAPTRVSTGGDTADSVQFTRDYSIACNAGDLVTITILSSNYPLDVQYVTGGGISWAQGTIRSLGSGYGNAYTYYGTSPSTQTFNLEVQFMNNTNNTIYDNLIRWYVWRNHGGVGYTGAYRGSGEPWLNVNQTTQKSAFVHASVDWNATAANGTWLNEAGTAADGVLVRSSAAIYWCNSSLDSTGTGTKRLGVTGTSSTRLTGVGLEIKGVYVDTDAPSMISSIGLQQVGPSTLRITWTPSSDDVGVAGYRVYDNGTQVGGDFSPSTLSFDHTNLAPLSQHSYIVKAFDAAGHLSNPGAAATFTMPPPYIDKTRWMGSMPVFIYGSVLASKVYVGTTQIWP